MSVLLGAIADDFTGATDLCNSLVGRGMRAVQVIGVPAGDIDVGDADAVVVALKSRSVPAAQAIAASRDALRWLQGIGARQFFFKYCSTFDSTPAGNIGPVADALMDALDARLAVVCPAFPANGRSIYMGHLFVGEQPLDESPMKDHPLNPMHDSSLLRLMAAQTRRPVGLVSRPVGAAGAEAISRAFTRLETEGARYAVVDAIDDADLAAIGRAVADHVLITGGSGVALGLPDNYRRHGLLNEGSQPGVPTVAGRSVVLAGSCSAATRGQLVAVRDKWPSLRLDPLRIARGEDIAAETIEWALSRPADTPVVIYASADPAEVARVQSQLGAEKAGGLIETTIADIASGLVTAGFRRLVVAGGETSGTVVSRLGIRALAIGAEIAPGVPWTETIDEPRIALALKSGNFGGDDFFQHAIGMLP